jgi:hypothetical protein
MVGVYITGATETIIQECSQKDDDWGIVINIFTVILMDIPMDIFLEII